jgi:nitrite reductase (NO-forming) / hydroxylamine reductase
MRKLTLVLVGFGLILFASCGGGAKKTESAVQDEPQQEMQEEVQQAEEPALDLTAGEAVFKEMCIACHMATGEGLAPAFPPLAGADYLLADKQRAVRQAIFGSKEPITVNGATYPGGIMKLTRELADQEVVDVVNYVLNSWGNDGGTVTLDNVAAARIAE